MPELPKSVIERLKSRSGAQAHPDADLLTAFSEQVLTGRERESVLEHLAVCAVCREAVALALPEVTAEQPVARFVPWYRRPQVFAWAGIAATVVVAASLVVNFRLRREFAPSATMERRAETGASAPAAAKTAPTPEMESKNAAPAADRSKAKAVLAPASPQKQAEAVASADSLMLKKEAKPAQEERRLAVASAPPPPAEKPQAKDGKVAAAERDQRADQLAAQIPAAKPAPAPAAMDSAGVARNQAASVAESSEIQTAAPPRATAAGAVGGLATESRAAQAYKVKADKVSTVFRWSISASGQLQRSLDSGRTWQTVSVDRQASFRAVAVVGADVWAGGAGALLYHSSDSGGHWTRQTLPGSTATIISLEFPDAQHGVARTADEASWSTSDGGQHWTKR